MLLAGFNIIGIDTIAEFRLAHAFISTGTLFFLFLLSLKIAGPVAALFAAVVAAGYPYFIFGVGALYPLTAFSFLLIASVYFLLIGKESFNTWFVILSGMFMGLAVLMRTSAAVLAVMVMFWLLLMLWRNPIKFLKFAFIYGFTMMLVVSPWLIRNDTTFGKPVLSTNGGRNLWLGNNPKSTIKSGSDIAMPADLEARIDAASELEADAIYTARALAFIKSNPPHYVKLALHKALALWRFDPSPTTDGYPRYKSLYRVISIVSVAPVFLLAVLGFYYADREQKKIMILFLLFAFVFSLLHAVYITKVRFRLPLDYFFILMAATAAAAITQRFFLLKRLPTRLSAGFLYDQNSSPFSTPSVHRRQSV
jgi:4-amino-4-deoxy-L-arabinose transferase-like glycosyltransferase